jgi:hypothetical protein
MRKALLVAILALVASPGCMWISLRFDPWQLPPVLPPEILPRTGANTPATLQSSPPEATADSAPVTGSEPSQPANK